MPLTDSLIYAVPLSRSSTCEPASSFNPLHNLPQVRLRLFSLTEGLFGLRFDEISEVVRIKQNDISSINTQEEDLELCSQGLVSLDGGDRIVQLLDLQKLFKKYNLPVISNDADKFRRSFRPRKQDITLLLNGQEYALAIDAIQEIIKPPKINRKVLVDPAIKGVFVLRDKLVNVVDLRILFKYPAEEISPESRIIILQGDLSVRHSGRLHQGSYPL